MSDMSKWPPSKDGKFTQAWVKLKELPGGMMQSYSAERGHFTYGPIPAFTSCAITTNPDEVEVWRARGGPVLAIYTADGVRAVDAPLPQRELDALLDHIYEHGTAAEGVRPLAVKLCQAYAASGVAVARKCLYCERDMIPGSECLSRAQSESCEVRAGGWE